MPRCAPSRLMSHGSSEREIPSGTHCVSADVRAGAVAISQAIYVHLTPAVCSAASSYARLAKAFRMSRSGGSKQLTGGRETTEMVSIHFQGDARGVAAPGAWLTLSTLGRFQKQSAPSPRLSRSRIARHCPAARYLACAYRSAIPLVCGRHTRSRCTLRGCASDLQLVLQGSQGLLSTLDVLIHAERVPRDVVAILSPAGMAEGSSPAMKVAGQKRNETLTPLTVRQLHTAIEQGSESGYLVDGEELHQVREPSDSPLLLAAWSAVFPRAFAIPWF